MAIDTLNKKLGLISFQQPHNTPIPVSSDGIGSGDKKHLIWDYPGITWATIIDNAKLSLISYHQPYNTPIPTPLGILTSDDKKHLIWEYAGLTWSEPPVEQPPSQIYGSGGGAPAINYRMAYRDDREMMEILWIMKKLGYLN